MSLSRPPVKLVECGRCAAPVVWVRLDTGSSVMCNPLPVVDPRRGNVLALLVGTGRRAALHGHIEARGKPAHPKAHRMTLHVTTCEAIPRPAPVDPGPTLFDLEEQTP